MQIIQRGIENNSSKKSIADTLGKDKSTIGKKIKNHRTLSYKSKYPVECVDAGKCPNMYSHHCSKSCLAFKSFIYKDVPALMAHATAVKDTSAAGSTSTSMKLLLHIKNMLKCSVMHVQVSMLRAMKSEIQVFLSSLCWNRDSLSTSSVRTIRKSKYPKEALYVYRRRCISGCRCCYPQSWPEKESTPQEFKEQEAPQYAKRQER